MQRLHETAEATAVRINKNSTSSCRFCCIGMGKHTVYDSGKKELFWLCDKHKEKYNIAEDTIKG